MMKRSGWCPAKMLMQQSTQLFQPSLSAEAVFRNWICRDVTNCFGGGEGVLGGIGLEEPQIQKWVSGEKERRKKSEESLDWRVATPIWCCVRAGERALMGAAPVRHGESVREMREKEEWRK
jgi:hypothetical protein